MSKKEFLNQLRKGLFGLPKDDIEEHINFYSEMIDIDTSTGDVRVPNTTTGGICRIRTSTGDVTFEIKA